MRKIKKLNVTSIAFCVHSQPANMINYLLNKSDKSDELDPGDKMFLLDYTADKLTVGIHKNIDPDDRAKIENATTELGEFIDVMPPALSQAILRLIKMASAGNAHLLKSDDSSRLDALEALIVEKFGKSKKDEYSFPDKFLPPVLQEKIAKKRIEDLQKAIDDNPNPEPKKKKPQKKSIDGYNQNDDDDDDDPDELEGMPTLSGFLNYHHPKGVEG